MTDQAPQRRGLHRANPTAQALADFSVFVGRHHQKEVVAELARQLGLRATGFPGAYRHEADLQFQLTTEVEQILAALATGRLGAELVARMAAWEAAWRADTDDDEGPELRPLAVLAAQKQALLGFVAAFTSDVVTALEVVHALDEAYLHARGTALEAVARRYAALADRLAAVEAGRDRAAELVEAAAAAARAALAAGDAERALRHFAHAGDLARLAAGTLRVVKVSLDPAQLLAGVAAGLRSEADRAGVALRVEAPTRCPRIGADPARLADTLAVLIARAIGQAGAGGEVVASARIEHDFLFCEIAPLPTPGEGEEAWARMPDLAVARGVVHAHGGAFGFLPADGGQARAWFTVPVGPGTGKLAEEAARTRRRRR